MITAIILFLVAYLLRIGSLRDGISDRALVYTGSKELRVGWQPWHYWGWLPRDLAQLILLILAGTHLSFGVVGMLVWLLLNGILNLGLHAWLYSYGQDNRHRFAWGQYKPKWFLIWEGIIKWFANARG